MPYFTKNFKYFLPIFLFVCLSSNGQYQWTEGILYLKSGIEKRGLVKLTLLSKDYINFNGKDLVKFRKDKKDSVQRYDESHIEKVVVLNENKQPIIFKYVPISKRKKSLFGTLCTGKANLYARMVSITSASHAGMVMNFNSFNEFYIHKEGESFAAPLLTARPSSSFRNRGKKYFSDCPTVLNKLKSKNYKRKDIVKMVVEYNSCFN